MRFQYREPGDRARTKENPNEPGQCSIDDMHNKYGTYSSRTHRCTFQAAVTYVHAHEVAKIHSRFDHPFKDHPTAIPQIQFTHVCVILNLLNNDHGAQVRLLRYS